MKLQDLPVLGAGIGHRREIHDGILASSDEVDFLEIIPEKYISASRTAMESLDKISGLFTVIPHGVSLSVGTAAPVSKTFLRSIDEICRRVKAPYYSDHLALTQTAGIDIGHLSPVPYNDETLGWVADNVNRVQDYLRLPFVIENITETHDIPGSTMNVAEFLHHVIDRTGCGMLFDVTNLYTNSVNHGFDALSFAREMPLHAVVQLHLAGGEWEGDRLIDSHSQPVPQKVWSLFEALLGDMPRLRGAVIERDGNYPEFGLLLQELRMVREVLAKSPTASEGAAARRSRLAQDALVA